MSTQQVQIHLQSSKKIGLEVNTDKSKSISQNQNVCQIHNITAMYRQTILCCPTYCQHCHTL